MDNQIAVQATNISKIYRLYNKPFDRLKESLSIKRKEYHQEHFALDKVSLTVNKGECFGIIGTNGSGKSTLLKIITGVLSPSSGSVEVNGKISALLELGTGFNMEYTGIENIYLNGTMMGYTREEMDEKVDAITSFAEIGKFIYQPVKTYSSGMFARLAFAVAINVDPEILIVDEALSVGDIFFQSKCYRKFEEFKNLGKTIIFVSHDLSSVMKYCDRSMLLNKGQLITVADTKIVVDLFKKILSKKDDDFSEDKKIIEDNTPKKQTTKRNKNNPSDVAAWKNSMIINPHFIEYGNKSAEIFDFAVTNSKDVLSPSIHKDANFFIRIKIKFNEKIENPIFAYTIKDLKGTEVTGTNTELENQIIPIAYPNDIYEVEFKQSMSLQGGQYLLSIACTGYNNENFKIYHRLYDICNIEVLSSKNTIGFFDIHATSNIKKIN